MASHKTYTTKNSGFTLIEVLVVIGLVTVISGMAVVVNMDSFRGDNFRAVRDTFVSSLQHARALSINNVCYSTPLIPCTEGKPHGVHINKYPSGSISDFVLFQGTTYSSTDILNSKVEVGEKISKAITYSGLSDIDFEQLTGNTTAGTVTLTDGVKSSVITIGSDGQISWTN